MQSHQRHSDTPLADLNPLLINDDLLEVFWPRVEFVELLIANYARQIVGVTLTRIHDRSSVLLKLQTKPGSPDLPQVVKWEAYPGQPIITRTGLLVVNIKPMLLHPEILLPQGVEPLIPYGVDAKCIWNEKDGSYSASVEIHDRKTELNSNVWSPTASDILNKVLDWDSPGDKPVDAWKEIDDA